MSLLNSPRLRASFEVAARLFGASEALRESLRTAIAPVDRQRIREAQELSRASLGEEGYKAAQVAGRNKTPRAGR